MHVAQLNGVPLPLAIDDAIDDLSGVVLVGEHLLLGNDEGHHLLRCRLNPEIDRWELADTLKLGKGGQEADIEALAYADGYLYAVGSHSLRRRVLKPAVHSVKHNRKRFGQLVAEKARNRLYRIAFDRVSGQFGEIASISLSKRLRKNPLLAPFSAVPSKENGIDIEGLALHRGQIYLGFRGPVLRHNLVPVMVLDFDHPKDYVLRFVDLRGQGIRDMVSLGDAMLVLTGPVGDGPGPFRLWLWDGQDQMPGVDAHFRPAQRLGNLAVPEGGRAEGLALLHASGDQVELLLVIDGIGQQRAQRISLSLPAR